MAGRVATGTRSIAFTLATVLVAAVAPALTWVAAAPPAAAADDPVVPDAPLSKVIDTMATCQTSSGPVPGVRVADQCVPGMANTIGVQFVAVDRATLNVKRNVFLSSNVRIEWDNFHGDLVILSAPVAYQTAPGQLDFDFFSQRNISSALNGLGAGPFSLVGVSGGCLQCATVNDGLRLDVPDRPDKQNRKRGQIVGFLQRDNNLNYVFVSPDYVRFDTAVPGSPTDAPVMRVGEREYSSPDAATIAPGASGFQVLTLDPGDLTPAGDPRMYVTNNADGSANAAGLDGLHTALTNPNKLLLVQSFNSPRAASVAWNGIAADLAAMDATKPLVMSLNNPSLPGLHSPTGYALAGYNGRLAFPVVVAPRGMEAWQAAAGETIAVHGLLSRTHDSVFAPFIGDSSGLFDPGLNEIVYQQPGPAFPFSTGQGAETVAAIQAQLAALPPGFPTDTDLRSEYWRAIGSTHWDAFATQLHSLTNPDPARYPLYDVVKAQLEREFSAVIAIRTALVDDGGPVGLLKVAFEAARPTLDAISHGLQQALEETEVPPPTGPDVLGIVLNVLTMVAGVTAAGPAFKALGTAIGVGESLMDGATMLGAAAVTVSGAVGMSAVFAADGGGGLDAAIDGVETAATALSTVLTNQMVNSLEQTERVAQILVADYGKLMAAGASYRSQPALTSPNADTATQLINTFKIATEQKIFDELLPAGLQKSDNNKNNFYPDRCFDSPPGSEQASVDQFVMKDGQFTHEDKSDFFFLRYTGDNDKFNLDPPPELAEAMFGPVGGDEVALGGVGVPPAALDPEIWLYHANLDTSFDLCAETAVAHDIFGEDPDTAPAIEPVNGAGQHAAQDTRFAQPLTVRVTNVEGMPAQPGQDADLPPAATVQFTTPGIEFASFGGSVTVTRVTGSGGLATSPGIVAGSETGPFDVSANAGARAAVTFVTDPPLDLAIVDDGLQAAPNTRFALPLAVKLTKAGEPDDPAVDREVVFRIETGNAVFYDRQVAGAVAAHVRTDSEGFAITPPIRALGATGPVRVRIQLPGHSTPEAVATLQITATPQAPRPDVLLEPDPPSPALIGDPVTVAATVVGFPFQRPGGSVTFGIDDEAPVLVPLDPLTGVATLPPRIDLAAGDHDITASYSGGNGYGPAQVATTYTVSLLAADLTVTSPVNASAVGQAVRFTASIPAVTTRTGNRPAVTGTVSFAVDGHPLSAAPVVGGIAVSSSIDTLEPGVHNVVVDYPGDANYRAAEVTYVQTVVGKWNTSVTVTADAPSPWVGQSVTYSVAVRSTRDGASQPTGRVRFLDNFTAIPGCDGLLLASGTAQCRYAYPEVGTHTIAVAYIGDAAHEANQSDGFDLTVGRAPTVTQLDSSPSPSVVGQQVVVRAHIVVQLPGAAAITGTVAFSEGPTTLPGCAAVPVENGVAACPTTWPTVGEHVLVARYSGDARLRPSTSSEYGHRVNAGATTTTLTVTPSPGVVGGAVTLNASVQVQAPASGSPGGSIVFTDGGTPISGCSGVPVVSAADSAAAACTVSYEHVGTHDFRARYSGDGAFQASASATVSHTVDRSPSTLIADKAKSVLFGGYTLTVHLASGTTGAPLAGRQVTLTAGSALVCSVVTDATGTGSCKSAGKTLNVALAGKYTASFAGDPDYLPASAVGAVGGR